MIGSLAISQNELHLKNLKMLDLSYNNIILLEQFLCKMNISILNLSNNPLNEKFLRILPFQAIECSLGNYSFFFY